MVSFNKLTMTLEELSNKNLPSNKQLVPVYLNVPLCACL